MEYTTQSSGRADIVVAEALGMARNQAKHLFIEKRVMVDGVCCKASAKLREGIVFSVADAVTKEAKVFPLPHILHEEDDFLVINKAAGIAVHKAHARDSGTTIVDILQQHNIALSDLEDDPLRPGVVHRLDKDTSGVLLVAKNAQWHAAVKKQFQDRMVEKHYVALVHGKPSVEEADIKGPIKRSEHNRTKMMLAPDGKSAHSRYRITEQYGPYTLLDVQIFTGRTHQIRVHLSSIGHPVVADAIYGKRKEKIALKRQFLHASSISFLDAQKKRAFEAPLSDDLARFLKSIS